MGTGPSGTVTTELPRDERVPTRGQSTDGPIVMGLTHCDDGMEHAWSPGRSAADDASTRWTGWGRRRVAGTECRGPRGRAGLGRVAAH